jgi:hypothetical protein
VTQHTYTEPYPTVEGTSGPVEIVTLDTETCWADVRRVVVDSMYEGDDPAEATHVFEFRTKIEPEEIERLEALRGQVATS